MSIGTDFCSEPIVALPGVNVTVASCVAPCTFVVDASVALGVTGIIVGV